MSEPKILEFLKNFHVPISSGSISNILIKNKEDFHNEKNDIFNAGLNSTPFQQIDDTSARVFGQNRYVQVLCNPLYTAYFTTKKKNRLTILDILRSFRERKFCFNEEALTLLEQLRFSQRIIQELNTFEKNKDLTTKEILRLLKTSFPKMGKLQKTRILEATGIAYYHKELEHPIVKLLLCDDAPQFKLLTDELALCRIHDGRHYKKLTPIVPKMLKKLMIFYKNTGNFTGNFWNIKIIHQRQKLNYYLNSSIYYSPLRPVTKI